MSLIWSCGAEFTSHQRAAFIQFLTSQYGKSSLSVFTGHDFHLPVSTGHTNFGPHDSKVARTASNAGARLQALNAQGLPSVFCALYWLTFAACRVLFADGTTLAG
jgi:hypothetical protein